MSKVPKLRFKEFSGEWEEKKLNDVGLITTGSTPSTSISEYYGGERLFVSPVDIQGNRYINKTKTTLTELGFSKGRKVVKDSVCFVCIGSTIGKVAQLTEDSLTNQQINCITANNKNFNDFVYSLLELKASKIKLLAGEQALPQINKSDFSKLKFYLPSLQEQEKIASFLISIDTRIEQLTKKEELLQQYKKGVMQKIFNQEIRFKADDGSEFCEWEEKTIDKLPILISDGNYGELYPTSDDFKPNGVPFLRANNIKNLKIDTSDTKYISEEQHSTLTAGHLLTNDILITTRGELGNLALIENEHNSSNINAQICLLRITDTSKLNYLYLLYALDYRDSKKQYKAFETGTALKQLPKGNLKKVKLKVPCLEEQTKIANFLSSTDNKIEQVQKQLNFIKEFKKALLHQMFV